MDEQLITGLIPEEILLNRFLFDAHQWKFIEELTEANWDQCRDEYVGMMDRMERIGSPSTSIPDFLHFMVRISKIGAHYHPENAKENKAINKLLHVADDLASKRMKKLEKVRRRG